MAKDLIQYAFAAGELSEKLFGRGDFAKYDFGLSQAYNFFVDYRGGLSTRPGTEFIDFLEAPGSDTRCFPFQYSLDVENSYIVIFGDGYIRFVQSGAFVLESPVTITGATAATPPVITAVAHGFSNGDWVQISGIGGMTELNGRTFEVANKTTDTFELVDVVTGASLVGAGYTAYTSGGTVSRIYTLASPYDESDLQKLKSYQIRDYLRLTHPDYPVKNLTRVGHTNWTLTDEAIGDTGDRPTGLAATASGAGSASVAIAVTAVDSNGNESIASDVLLKTSIVNYTTTAGYLTITWTPVAGAEYYRVYRSLVLSGGGVHGGMQLGYIGRAVAPIFTDNNIVPDFTSSPPQHYNPFADGAISSITITNGGSGYTSPPTVTVSGAPGSGFIGYAVLNGDEVAAVVILNRGEGYVSPTVGFSGGGGSGATATAAAGASSGNYPAVSATFQQRQVYAASYNQPLTIWGSKPGQLSNFDTSAILNSGDSYEFDLDSPTVAPIRHLVSMRGGLLALSAFGVWQLSGGSGVVTPNNALAEPQSYLGCADVPPLFVDTDLLYVTDKDSTVRLLSYNDYSKLYGGQDVSILSNHLFSAERNIVRWTYAATPFRLATAVRADGLALQFTVVKEQEVFAWARMATQGFYRDVCTVQEDNVDVTYVTVERYIGGNKVKMLERVAPREFSHVEDAICVDAALVLTATYPAATLTLNAVAEGAEVTVTAGASVFSSGNVGDVIRVGGGKILITAYTSGTVVTGTIVREVTDLIWETGEPRPYASGEWTLDTPVTTVSGLWHLEGETVKVLADGNVLADKTVADGAITLGTSATRVVVGLGYRCLAETLPPVASDAIIESKRKNVVGVAVRLHESRGLSYGTSETDLFEMKERTDELLGEPTRLQSGVRVLDVSDNWSTESTMFFVQDNPLPATLLALVPEMEIGDDKN